MLTIGLSEDRLLPVFSYELYTGRRIDILFDTGTIMSVLDPNQINIYKAFPNILNSGVTMNITSVHSTSVQEIWYIPAFRVGNFTAYNLPVILMDLSKNKVQMILASNVFKRNRFTIDYLSHEISVTDMANPATQFECKSVNGVFAGLDIFALN